MDINLAISVKPQVALEMQFLIRFGLNVKITGSIFRSDFPQGIEELTMAELEEHFSGYDRDHKVRIHIHNASQFRRNLLLKNAIARYGSEELVKKVKLVRKDGEIHKRRLAAQAQPLSKPVRCDSQEMVNAFVRGLEPLRDRGLIGLHQQFVEELGNTGSWAGVKGTTLMEHLSEFLVSVFTARQTQRCGMTDSGSQSHTMGLLPASQQLHVLRQEAV